MNRENKRSVSVEDLLRLKRAEKPPAEFWESFDRELRAKQLAALVEKRPWWRNLSRAFSGLSRYHLPLGATAILAVTFVATRDYRTPVPVVASEVAETIAPSSGVTVFSPTAAMARESSVVAAAAPVSVELEATSIPSTEREAALPAAELAADFSTPAVRVDTPSSRYIAENLKAAQAAEPAVARGLLSQVRGFETRALPSRSSAVEPLSQMTTPAAARIAKLNSAIAVSFGQEGGARTSERVARRLSNDGDDRLYETVSRLDARGNKLGWKF